MKEREGAPGSAVRHPGEADLAWTTRGRVDGRQRRRLAACRAESWQGHASRGEKARAEGFRLNLWACGRFGWGRDVWPARWPRRRTDAARRPSAGRREVEEPVSGSSVIFSKFKNPVT